MPFAAWHDETSYHRIWHVDQRHPKADDTNVGSEDLPLLTIQAAAERAHAGVNPFAMINGPCAPWYGKDVAPIFKLTDPAQQKVVLRRRGMLFCDGTRLSQVNNYFELGEADGTFFVEDVNGVGIDIGFSCPAVESNAPRGFQIVSHCAIRRCGICGVPGSTDSIPYIDMQQSCIHVPGNEFHDNCWQDYEELQESAAIKLHHMRDSLIAGNSIRRTFHGNGIWVDASCENVAVRENVIVESRHHFGGIFIEASHDDLDVSHNVIVNSRCHGERGGNGIYSHNCDEIMNRRNIVLGAEGYGMLHLYGTTSRINLGRGNTGYGIRFSENIIAGCKYALMQPTDKGESDRNIYGRFSEGGYLKVGLPPLHLNLAAWRKYLQWDLHGYHADIAYALVMEKSLLSLAITHEGKTVESLFRLRKPLGQQIDDLFHELNREGYPQIR